MRKLTTPVHRTLGRACSPRRRGSSTPRRTRRRWASSEDLFTSTCRRRWLFLVAAIVCRRRTASGSCSSRSRAPTRWALAAAELGRAVRRAHAGDRAAVGAQGVGRVVGVGSAADLEPDAVPDLRRLPAAAQYGGPGSDKLGAGMALFGMANVPFIYVSVNSGARCTRRPRSCRRCPSTWAFRCGSASRRSRCCSSSLLTLRARLEHQRARVEALYLAEDEA